MCRYERVYFAAGNARMLLSRIKNIHPSLLIFEFVDWYVEYSFKKLLRSLYHNRLQLLF